ncbi:MAG: Glyoxalase family protein [Pedosphaera sp.]|nr:Glyoxalase family protein [Pedosphaera sp.]
MSANRLPDETRISQVHLRIADLERALGFYQELLGFRAIKKAAKHAVLGATEQGPGLIVLTEDKHVCPRPSHATGLYHFAIRYPARSDLAQALVRLAKGDYPIQGASDHIVSEAIYLSDPDHNGVELYVDRPRSQWTWREGQIAMSTEALDLDDLLATIEGQSETEGPPIATDIGHVHLHVADLTKAERFYGEFLGLAVTQRSYPGALFLSAGGYHHHVAVNTWAGRTAPPPNSVGLVSYRLEVPVAEVLYCLRHRAPLHGYEAELETAEEGADLLKIRDPNGNWLEIEAARTAQPIGAG